MFYLYREQKKSLAVPLPEVLKLKHKTRLVEVYFGKWARDGKKRAFWMYDYTCVSQHSIAFESKNA
ncbi:hypothetical protein T4B_3531 [Trichinella pseudospiralis]|uniref:Uncharacterized protein n=1 Tax=Trichinella pseudospiralis TaxID=6337 RepID=A0A0V1JGX5_TRIPS|nr:hypothetical protein T4B_3531 [Trichinella pseudospiralis]